MATYSVWVHGNVARAQWVADLATMPVEAIRADGVTGRIPWTDLVGLPQGPGITFRGKGRPAVKSTAQPAAAPLPPPIYFHFPLPTPVAAANTRAKLLRVFVLWKATNGTLQEVYAYDGPTAVLSVQTSAADGFDGSNVRDLDKDLVEGVTRFTLKATEPHSMVFGLGISVGFGFAKDGHITFTAAGADFEI